MTQKKKSHEALLPAVVLVQCVEAVYSAGGAGEESSGTYIKPSNWAHLNGEDVLSVLGWIPGKHLTGNSLQRLIRMRDAHLW